jgi:hypothetical protein
MIDIGFRTLVRAFLLVGGLIFLVQGAIDGSVSELGLGAMAVLLGGVGLWWEWRKQSGADEPRENV